jgi:hypothetical protein
MYVFLDKFYMESLFYLNGLLREGSTHLEHRRSNGFDWVCAGVYANVQE